MLAVCQGLIINAIFLLWLITNLRLLSIMLVISVADKLVKMSRQTVSLMAVPVFEILIGISFPLVASPVPFHLSGMVVILACGGVYPLVSDLFWHNTPRTSWLLIENFG